MSSSRTRQCSWRVPQRPGAEPRFAERTFSTNLRLFSSSWCSGTCWRSSSRIGRNNCVGRRRGSVSLFRVSWLPGANGDATSFFAARESSPRRTCSITDAKSGASSSSAAASSAAASWGCTAGRAPPRGTCRTAALLIADLSASRRSPSYSPRENRRTRSLKIAPPSWPCWSRRVSSMREMKRCSLKARSWSRSSKSFSVCVS